jgi:hypothetical protein
LNPEEDLASPLSSAADRGASTLLVPTPVRVGTLQKVNYPLKFGKGLIAFPRQDARFHGGLDRPIPLVGV